MRLPALMMAVVLTISILIDIYIWWDLKRSSKRHKVPCAYLAGALICWIYLIVVWALPKRGEASVVPLMWMLYAYITVYLPKLCYCLLSLLGSLFRFPKPFRIAGLAVALIVFIGLWWGALVTRSRVDVRHVELEMPRLPESFDGLKIVQFSDAHVGTWGSDTTFVARLVDSILAQKPDLILFTGDIVNRRTSEVLPFIKPLSRLKAPLGVYSVLGNHDYSDYCEWPSESEKLKDRAELVSIEKEMGWRLLNNESIILRNGSDSIALVGVENWGEPPFPSYGDLKKAYPAGSDGQFKILMSHNPEHWRQVVSEEFDADLTLSGHTHAMQFQLSALGHKWSPAQWRYKNWAGLYDSGNNPGRYLYVNIGSGEVGIPARIGATPELTVFTLKSK